MSRKKPKTKPKPTVDAEGFQESLDFGIPTKDTALRATVTGVKLATRGSLFEKSKYGEDSDMMIVVRLALGDASFTHFMNAPNEGAPLHPKSTAFAWNERYGMLPESGQKVDILIDTEGYYKVIL